MGKKRENLKKTILFTAIQDGPDPLQNGDYHKSSTLYHNGYSVKYDMSSKTYARNLKIGRMSFRAEFEADTEYQPLGEGSKTQANGFDWDDVS